MYARHRPHGRDARMDACASAIAAGRKSGLLEILDAASAGRCPLHPDCRWRCTVCPAEDHAGRGEFFVLLAMTNREAAQKFAAEIRQRLRNDAVAWRLLGATSGLDCRIGIAAFPEDAVTGPELHFAAQKALEATHVARRIASAHELVA